MASLQVLATPPLDGNFAGWIIALSVHCADETGHRRQYLMTGIDLLSTGFSVKGYFVSHHVSVTLCQSCPFGLVPDRIPLLMYIDTETLIVFGYPAQNDIRFNV